LFSGGEEKEVPQSGLGTTCWVGGIHDRGNKCRRYVIKFRRAGGGKKHSAPEFEGNGRSMELNVYLNKL